MNLNYTVLRLNDLLKTHDEDTVKSILRTYDSPYNRDVDRFLKEKAIIFDRQGLSKTHLVFTSYRKEMVLVGYFALVNKNFVIKNGSTKISKRQKQRIAKFAQYDRDTNQYVISAPLIGQLGKNYNYRNLISGDILLEYACNVVRDAQALLGGKLVYLECEDVPQLLDFYSNNGFFNFGKRYLEADEKDTLNGTYLIQMLKYLK